MEMNKIIEGNKLIGEFLYPEMLDKEKIEEEGLELSNHMFQKMCVYLEHYKDMKYHSSWDWLIPCINAITSMKEYFKFKDHTSSMISEEGIYINTKFIENTWNDIVTFIKWYNENK